MHHDFLPAVPRRIDSRRRRCRWRARRAFRRRLLPRARRWGRVVIISADGDAPYQRPPLSKDFLRGESEESALPMESLDFFRENRIEVWLAESTSRPATAGGSGRRTDCGRCPAGGSGRTRGRAARPVEPTWPSSGGTGRPGVVATGGSRVADRAAGVVRRRRPCEPRLRPMDCRPAGDRAARLVSSRRRLPRPASRKLPGTISCRASPLSISVHRPAGRQQGRDDLLNAESIGKLFTAAFYLARAGGAPDPELIADLRGHDRSFGQ
jgi:hypothetical protein